MANNDSNYSSREQAEHSPGPFLAKVVGHMDTTFMGVLEVEILRPSGNLSNDTQLRQVKYMSPFYGVTSANHLGDTDDYNNTQKSYGMWMVPPDVGTIVVVFFIDGDPRRGYWMGSVMDEGMNFMLPGMAATQKVVEDVEADSAGSYGRVPTAEFNKKVKNTNDPDASQAYKPRHPFTDVLDRQGLLFDDTRGITTSSARRETPSMVFGISTPGPVDKQSGAQRGRIGKDEWKIDNAFVSRLGGSTFVMDDGDDRFLRKTKAGEGPPEYVSLENGETGGDVTIPHNELIRFRTRTGHQILLHNSEDLIYITNARGTSWIEMTSNGKIDIYAKDSISINTEADLNFTASRDINFTAGARINMNATTDISVSTATNFSLKATNSGKITVKTMDLTGSNGVKLTSGAALDVKSTGASKWTAGGAASLGGATVVISGGSIDLNGPAAPAAAAAALAEDAPVAVRVPQTEPWNGHENLDPTSFTAEKTKAVKKADATTAEDPSYFKKYTTSVDTFARVPPPATAEEQEESGT